jgi:hypothetical protein
MSRGTIEENVGGFSRTDFPCDGLKREGEEVI